MNKKIISEPQLIVSFTSFPARIQFIPQVVENLFQQSRQPDKICLYLFKEQFPHLENDLPKELAEFQENRKIRIQFVDDDLKGHKKYFYSMQEFPNDIIVTIDDDLIYPRNMLEMLYSSYLKYPKTVSTCRAHYMVFQDGIPSRYKIWLNCSNECIGLPSMQLFATGGAGCLYPPHIFDSCKEILFDKELIKKFCLAQDDVWLKTAELLAEVPVVLVAKHPGLHYIPGTQDVGLWNTVNKFPSETGKTPNDQAFDKIFAWADQKLGKGKLLASLFLPVYKQTEVSEEKNMHIISNRFKTSASKCSRKQGKFKTWRRNAKILKMI